MTHLAKGDPLVDIQDENDISVSGSKEIPDQAPDFDIKEIMTMFKERGFVETMEDEVYSPHTHLLLVISMIVLIALCTAIFSVFLL